MVLLINKKAQEIYETIVEHQGLEKVMSFFKWLRFWNETFY